MVYYLTSQSTCTTLSNFLPIFALSHPHEVRKHKQDDDDDSEQREQPRLSDEGPDARDECDACDEQTKSDPRRRLDQPPDERTYKVKCAGLGVVNFAKIIEEVRIFHV